MRHLLCVPLLITCVLAQGIPPGHGLGDDPLPLFDGPYDASLPTPEDWLGFPLGSFPVSHAQSLGYLRALAEACDHAELEVYGQTFEGRELAVFRVSNPKNFARRVEIQRGMARLAHPAELGAEEAEALLAGPAVAWMAYSIHGDELSSTDAALQLAWQLAAGLDEVSHAIRDNLVVCIDPLQNPDGRMRFVQQLRQFSGRAPSFDLSSLAHSGVWPWGRGNHYLFDLNRDWFSLVHEESRAKARALLAWNPQLVVDCHEMGALDTYLFNPPRAPFNPYLPEGTRAWWDRFAADQAAAFDQFGWPYYTGEWNEELFPGYGSSWPLYYGAIGILYEQAGVNGSAVKQADGTVLSYRESVHHQLVSSVANLSTAAQHRRTLLERFYANKRTALATPGAFVFPPHRDPSRLAAFAAVLDDQNVELEMLRAPLPLPDDVTAPAGSPPPGALPAGSLVVRLGQPAGPLVAAILDWDIRLGDDVLAAERRSRLSGEGTTMYEATGWSLALGYGLDGFRLSSLALDATTPWTPPPARGALLAEAPAFAWMLDGDSHGALEVLCRLLEEGVQVGCLLAEVAIDGQRFPAGSLVIPRRPNPGLTAGRLADLARLYDVRIAGTDTALAEEGPDLGGGDVALLVAPRIAILCGEDVSTTGFGALWHLVDGRLGLRATLLPSDRFRRADLDKYNVLLLPPGSYGDVVGERLEGWVRDGGTLIACGSALDDLTGEEGLSGLVRKRDVLDELGSYERALRELEAARLPVIDSLAVWENRAPEEAPAYDSPEVDEEADRLARQLSPSGVILAVDVDPDHWLGFGSPPRVPVMFRSGTAWLTKDAEVGAHLAPAERLRLSGLLWPEARERWARSVYLSRERVGGGQVILFAGHPAFRGYFRGSERLLLNALLLGPGVGTRNRPGW